MTSTHLDRLAVEKLFRVRQHLLGDLSASIALRPGELRIAFGGAEDLAAEWKKNKDLKPLVDVVTALVAAADRVGGDVKIVVALNIPDDHF